MQKKWEIIKQMDYYCIHKTHNNSAKASHLLGINTGFYQEQKEYFLNKPIGIAEYKLHLPMKQIKELISEEINKK